MTKITLSLKGPLSLPIEAENISPDCFKGLSKAEIAALPILLGRRQISIGDLFDIDLSIASSASDGLPEAAPDVTVEGDLSHVKRIGQGMNTGRLTIRGDAGMHLGAGMQGGELFVYGNTGAWTGAQMVGGMIRILGNTGPMLGAAYVGEKRGMRGGVIIVEGNAGPRAAERMRRGLIVVQGSMGEFAGSGMIAGSVFVLGQLGARTGAGMKRGTIVTMGGITGALLPTFNYACVYRPGFMPVYLQQLQAWGVPVKQEWLAGFFRRYAGDVNTLGKGEILIYDQR